RRDGRDVFEPRLPLARAVGGRKGLHPGCGRRFPLVRDRGGAMRDVGVTAERREKRSDLLRVPPAGGVMAERILDRAGQGHLNLLIERTLGAWTGAGNADGHEARSFLDREPSGLTL